MNESDLERRVGDVLRKRSEDEMRDVHVEEDLDTLRRRAKREARSRRTLGVAAALVMLVAGAALLLPERGSSAPDSVDAAAPSAIAGATPTPEPGGTVGVPPLASPGPGGWRPPVSPSGTVTGFVPYLEPTVNFSYTLPDGWLPVDRGNVHAPNAVVSWWAVDNVYADGCRWTLQNPPLGPSVDDLAAVWGKLPGFTATTPVDITVDGYAGKRVDFTLPDYDKTECVANEFLLWDAAPDFPRAQQLEGKQWAWVPEQQNRLWILDVDGTRLVIHEESNPGTTPEQLADMDQFLASVQIG